MGINKFTTLKIFTLSSEVGHLIIDSGSATTNLNALFNFFDQNRSITKMTVDSYLEIKEMILEIQTKTRLEVFNYCLINNRLKLAYGIDVPLVYGGTCDFSID